MPIYEYRCDSCENIHEVMQKFSDPLLEKCPECGSAVEKLMSLSAFALKGSGWYTTDYKRGGSKAAKKESTASESCGAPACGEGACSSASESAKTTA